MCFALRTTTKGFRDLRKSRRTYFPGLRLRANKWQEETVRSIAVNLLRLTIHNGRFPMIIVWQSYIELCTLFNLHFATLFCHLYNPASIFFCVCFSGWLIRIYSWDKWPSANKYNITGSVKNYATVTIYMR